MLTDQQAEEFVRRHWGLALQLCRAQFWWVYDSQQDDVVSDATLALWEAAKTYDSSKSSEITHVKHKVSWRLIDLYRERTPYSRSASKPVFYSLGTYMADIFAADDDYIGEQVDHLALRQVLSALQPRYRNLLVAYYLEGKTLMQIARASGISEARASQKVAEAVKQARKVVKYPSMRRN